MSKTKKQIANKHLPDYESIINQLMDQISRRNARLGWLKDEHKRITQEITEKEHTVQALSAQVAEKEQAMRPLSDQAAEKGQLAQALTAKVAEKEQSIQELKAQASEKEQSIQALKTQAAEKEHTAQLLTAQAVALSTQVAEKEHTVQVLTALVAEKEHTAQVLTAQVAEKEQSVQALSVQVAEKDRSEQALSAQVAEKEHAAQLITALVAEKEHTAQVLSAQVAEITISKAWQVALFLRRFRGLVAPPGGWRARLLRIIFTPILFPFQRIYRKQRQQKEEVALIRSSDLYDEKRYLAANPDISQTGMDPALHYLLFGGFEGRNPSPHFSSTEYLRTYEDVKKAGINPLIHYLKYGRKEGRKAQQVPQFLTSSGTIEMARNKKVKDIAVVLHLFYEDLFDEIKNYLQNLTNFDLYISMHQSNSGLKDRIFASFPDAKIFFVENRGRDMLPFISIYRNISLLNYRYLLKIHTKKSPHIEDGSTWRTDIYRKLLGSSEIINSAMLALERNPTIGVIGPKGHVIDYRIYWGKNKKKTEELARRVGISFGENKPFNFVAGTMFWAKPDALRYLSLLPIDLQEFEPEPLEQDGAFVHALERFIGLSVEKAGYSILEIDDRGKVSNPKKNSPNDLYPLYIAEGKQTIGEGNTAQKQNSDKNSINHLSMDIKDGANPDVFELVAYTNSLPTTLAERESQIKALTARVAEKEQSVETLTAQVSEINNSRTWKIALFSRRVSVLLVPPNSLRARVLRRLHRTFFHHDKSNRAQNLENDAALIRSSGLFDEAWYIRHNPDIVQAKVDPVQHYLLVGAFEGRDPGPAFNSKAYLANYKDVKKADLNPLVHFINHGRDEGRLANPKQAKILRGGKQADKQVITSESVESEIILPERRISVNIGQQIKVSVVIPTKNAGPLFRETLDKLIVQEYDGTIELIVIDSGSTDDTVALAGQYGALVTNITPEEFDHGLTRNRGIEIASGDIIVLMSQDAIPGNHHLIHNLVTAFDDPKVAGTFARQEPREDEDVLTKRNLKNWITGQKKEDIRCITDTIAYQSLSPMERFYFCSFDNVCSAIRKNVWSAIPFKANEFGEDIEWAQDALEAGWKIAYWPTAYVIHSHQRSCKYEYERTRLCHKKLYRQFGIHTVPSRKHVILSTFNSIKQDWGYALQNEKRPGALIKLLAEIPALSFAGVYGQYSGARSGIERTRNTAKKTAGEKLRIVLTVHQFVPEYLSGTEILTFETAKELKRLGHDVSVFTGSPAKGHLKDAERFDQYSIDGINVVRFHHNYFPMGSQSNSIEMEYYNVLFGSFFKNYLRQEKPNVVHFFHLMRLSASAVDACQELRIPTVFTPTDFWFICPTGQLRLPNNQNCYGPDKSSVNCLRHVVTNNQSDKIKAQVRKLPDWVLTVLLFFIKHGINIDAYYSPLIRAFLNRREFLVKRINLINKVITPTRIMHSMLTKNGLEDQRTISIPFGLNLAHLQNSERPKPSNLLRLGYIGTLSEHKGVHILVEAMKKLELKPIELRIYGKLDDYPEYVKELRKNSKDDPRIKFCGTFPNHEIGKVFSKLDALVVPSLWFENSPLVVYSAQAAKCPVIASNMDGMSDIIEHGKNGLLFEAGNSSKLAATIDSLLNDKNLLQKLSENSKMPLSIQEYAEKLVMIYRDLIKSEKTV
jgi:glycosyltransferase involved in cell wall biosynthesis/GT2 family glycosyltransferase/chemotaxis protein histidine kinase CheA